jgi:Tfp pilus assembly protein PilO
MTGSYPFKIPPRSILYIIACVVVLTVFIYLVLAPRQKTIAELDKDITNIDNRIKQQEAFYPVYEGYKKQIELGSKRILPLPHKEGLLWDRAEGISIMFREAAMNSGLEMISAVPEVDSLADNRGILALRLNLKGDFLDLRKFLSELGTMPYLEGIEEIAIQSSARGKEFRLKVLLALKQ